ncbi:MULTISPECIES: carboxymuconolactone decarboxylase family protein [unclassified Oceanispirochaeta]|uniref:carboxymuconolactone decarboxylase family protein n=1 Tax=unclassified Oceanispirochaeta TaxID=2635722 RepID=UPI000E0905A5|nr:MULTISPECIES: carboxymuconolactone decarboxylase family protein [unclassified Oceanispirochaeta]MBF9018394.1 carboxymuconolactone decarboxylase family protein [Oceanispirochaeta sp. M2]NPD75206.1 carboxymuconolactone decarboxylase family protein [Oceanispirochaeta sp. M1]RDG28924.1 carboxymuconolactone decarboxylase family protein [Oceanispirochaeta sp. M1]
MSDNPREMLNDFVNGLGEFGEMKSTQGNVEGFMNLLETTYKEGDAIDPKTKELISIGIAVFSRCLYCIVYHTYKALEAGAKKDEILQAAMVSVAFGGGPAMAYSVTLLKNSIEEFEKDFN